MVEENHFISLRLLLILHIFFLESIPATRYALKNACTPLLRGPNAEQQPKRKKKLGRNKRANQVKII